MYLCTQSFSSSLLLLFALESGVPWNQKSAVRKGSEWDFSGRNRVSCFLFSFLFISFLPSFLSGKKQAGLCKPWLLPFPCHESRAQAQRSKTSQYIYGPEPTWDKAQPNWMRIFCVRLQSCLSSPLETRSATPWRQKAKARSAKSVTVLSAT